MTNFKFSFLTALCLFLGVCNVWGENYSAKVVVETNEGAKTYEIYESGKLYFSNDFLVIDPASNTDGHSAAKIRLADINKLLFFDGETSNQDEIKNALSFDVYPNPATDYLSVRFASAESCPFSIYSINGEVVKSGKIQSGEKIEVYSLPAGVYFFNIGGMFIKFSKI
ncbi:MAG: T9SS type A sorting domain-containing protein [Paludibacteraceae bacterium]|nr:T9SS type A sorting domain-containing protein [Paludibacteraceae bacterium]